MSKFIPYPFYYDDMPIDISFVFEKEKPAGKHGFLKTNGQDFVFEDGTKVQFWGTNFNGRGCFPEHDYAEKVTKRLSKTGINMVRLHQLDAPWSFPNLFSFTAGKRNCGGSELNPDSMDRLDYLIYCCKKEGIYIYLDMFTYRKFKSDEGFSNTAALRTAGRPACIFNDRMIELQKELCKNLWQHENSYTGLRYCDDPVIVLAEIINEGDLFFKRHKIIEPYATEFMEKFDKWLCENSIDDKASNYEITDFESDRINDFRAYLQEKYYREMYEYMRACGVKIPITGTNWISSPEHQKIQLLTDFSDNHQYNNDGYWKEFEKCWHSHSVTTTPSSYLKGTGYASAANRPTFVSEWDMSWPNEFRADGTLYSAALGLLQGWSGFAVHTYSYSNSLHRTDMLGKEFTSEKIGDTPYRQGMFATWNDPAKYGLFYHAALMTRRGDVARAKTTMEIKPFSRTEWNRNPFAENIEKCAVVSDFNYGEKTYVKAGEYREDFNVDAEAGFAETKAESEPPLVDDIIVSDTGELLIDRKNNYGLIDTEKTKCAYGFLLKNGKIDLSGVSIKCDNDFAVIAMSSLTDDPIKTSDNILLTTVGRAENTDFKSENDFVVDYGKPPVRIEVINADIEIETENSEMVVWSINPDGYLSGLIPSIYEDGRLKFTLGNTSRSMYYLIFKE